MKRLKEAEREML